MVDAADIRGTGERIEKKKAKKKRKDRANGDAGPEKLSVNGVSNLENDSKPVAATDGVALPNGSKAKEESKEEKRRRKEEKRARKEAKAKAK